MTHWLVIGGGPTARVTWQGVGADKIIGCNRCLEFCQPDVYWISDPFAIARYRKLWEQYPGEIIIGANAGSLAMHNELTSLNRRHEHVPYLNAPLIYHAGASGVLCCRMALKRGATKLTLCGFDGHKYEDVWRDENDQPAGKYGDWANVRNSRMEASFEDMGKAHPDVQFILRGATLLRIPDLPNWGHDGSFDNQKD